MKSVSKNPVLTIDELGIIHETIRPIIVKNYCQGDDEKTKQEYQEIYQNMPAKDLAKKSLRNDIGMDSLDEVEFVMMVERDCGNVCLEDDVVEEELKILGDVARAVFHVLKSSDSLEGNSTKISGELWKRR